MKKKSININSEFKKFTLLFKLLKKSVILGDKIQNTINHKDIKKLKENTERIKKVLKTWGLFGNNEDKKRIDKYYIKNYEKNILNKCKSTKNENEKYKCETLKKRALGKHLNFLKVIFEECNNQLIFIQKISTKPQKFYTKKLLLSLSEFRGVMKFFPLDKAYKFHVSRINIFDLQQFLKKIKTFSKNNSIATFAITEKSARLIGELLKNQDIPQKIIYYAPDPITRKKIKKPEFIFKKEFPKLKIQNKNLLIIDEYIQTGDTLKISKKFFKRIGFKNVYTSSIYVNETCKYSPDFFIKKTFLTPPWYDFPIMLKEKVPRSFKTVPLKIESNLLESKLKKLKKKLINSLLKRLKQE